MRKPSTVTLVLIALVVGLGGGFQVGWRLLSHFSERTHHGLEIRAQEDKGDAVLRTLKLLRADSTNTVPFLESQLDDVVITLGPLAAESHNLMLGKIRDYRSKFPHSSSQPGVDSKISEVFSKIDEKH